MKRNFQFDPITVVRWGARSIDLHNAFDLTAFGTDLVGTQVVLAFKRNAHAIDPKGLPSEVALTCRGNVRVAFNDLRLLSARLDRDDIEIAYFDEGCDWPLFMDEAAAQSQEPRGLHIAFGDGLVVRIFCDEAAFDAAPYTVR